MTAPIASLVDMYDTIERLATDRPDNVALVSPGRRPTTYVALNGAIVSAATRLRQEGLGQGEAVAFSVRPSIEAIILILATVRAGATIVAADPGMGADLFAARMGAVRPTFAMAESLLYALSSSRIARRVLRSRHLELPEVGRMRGVRFVRVGRWLPGTPSSLDSAALMGPLGTAPDAPVALGADDAVFIVFTSGTTAEPRAVVHTARSIAATLDTSHLVSSLNAASVVVTDQLHSALPALLAGATVVLPRVGAPAAGIARLLHDVRATHAFLVPSELLRLITYCESRPLSLPTSLRQLVLGAGPAGRSLFARLQPLISSSTQVLSMYGLTEMAPVASVDMEEKLAWQGDGDLVGSPIAGACVRIDETGELWVAGARLCGRYLCGEPLTEVATGDLAQIDEKGRIVLLGRKKDMIIRGQHNIYPSLHEEKIAEIPGVARCALIGVWDDRLQDERVVLVVEPTAGESDTDALRGRVERALRVGALIDQIAMPDRIEIMPLPESGRSHKIDRERLRLSLTERIL